MTVKQNVRWVSLLLAAALLPQTGCVKSKNPLITPQKAQRDTRLLGAWRAEIPAADGKPRVVYCHIGGAGEKFPEGVMGAVTVQFEDDVPKQTATFFFAAAIDGAVYLNTMEFPKDKAPKEQAPEIVTGYTITKCEVSDSELTFHQIDRAALKEAVESKKIQGEIAKDGSVTLTAPTDDLVRFFKENGEKIFSGEKVVFKRIETKHSEAAADDRKPK